MRGKRRSHEGEVGDKDSLKSLIYFFGGVLGLAVLTFALTFTLYSNRTSEENASQLDIAKVTDLVPSVSNIEDDTSQASTQMGKTVEEAENEINNIAETNSIIEGKVIAENNVKTTVETQTAVKETPKQEEKKPEIRKELVFEKPVEGEIILEFAMEKLVYSETLKEWITHPGIDIKAERTTVVKVAEAGTVKAIKNDPRYGLTVIVEHEDGFTTVYSNLLTAEFVTVGESLERGQTLGTVGNTATFESVSEPHLHFEILKDNEYVDPTIYISF